MSTDPTTRRPGRALLSAAMLTAMLPSLALAQPAAAAVADPDSALAVAIAGLPGEPITLETAVSAALARATAVGVARADLAAASGAARREEGRFDPELYAEAARSSDSQPAASLFLGADVLETEASRAEAGARVVLPLGTRVSASLNADRVTTNSAYALLSPQVDTFGQLEVVQPLLRGFGAGASGEAEAAVRGEAAAEAAYSQARLATQADVEVTYWSIYAAERDLAVQRIIRDRAARFLAEVETRAGSGLVGPSEAASARVFLAQQEQAVLDVEEALDALCDRLATLMGIQARRGAHRFRPIDEPVAVVDAPPLDELLALTLAGNRTVAAAEARLAASRALAAGARANARPRLDVFGRLGGRGLAGTGRDVPGFGGGPDTLSYELDTGVGQGIEQVFRRDYPTWSVGVEFSLPLGGGAVAGERDRQEAEVARAEQQLEGLRRILGEQVRRQHRELSRSQRRLQFAQDGVTASLEQVRVGTMRFRAGRTTAFELVRLSADLADAQRRFSVALVRTARTVATLRQLTAGAYPGPLLAISAAKETTP